MAASSLCNHTVLHLSSGVTRPLPRTGELVLGRENVDAPLFGRGTSRRHARISIDNGGSVFIEDIGSSHGTFVAGVALRPGAKKEWKAGMEVRFGSAGKGAHDTGKLVVGVRPQHAFLLAQIQGLHSSRHESAEVTFLDDQTGEEIERAHRFVVELQSPVIKAMLSSTTQESQTLAIKVQKDFVPIWPKVIRYLYGHGYFSGGVDGNGEETIESVAQLRKSAEYYQFTELAEETSQHMRVMFCNAITLTWFRTIMEQLPFDKPLVHFALQALDSKLDTVIPLKNGDRKSLNQCRLETVVEIFSRDAFKCSGLELFKAAKDWAACNSPNKKIPEELLNVIRFEHIPKDELFAIKHELPLDVYTGALEQILGVANNMTRPKRKGATAEPATPFSKFPKVHLEMLDEMPLSDYSL
eukprot:TRINITY_DN14217_c0_g1_i1.p1 TRINITY_DN14217_c0_g1~~TRINITY_DN14217_c0_g1_i1.p1  ORF type:complete len:412 (+),score=42.17 TRINITY_DN14217_c0_g1_i1:48-1283(+)